MSRRFLFITLCVTEMNYNEFGFCLDSKRFIGLVILFKFLFFLNSLFRDKQRVEKIKMVEVTLNI